MRYRKAYLFVVLSIAFLVLLHQGQQQYLLSQKQNDAITINKGGRQRMLSQQITALAFEYHLIPNATLKQKLMNSFQEWSNIHLALKNGDEALQIDKVIAAAQPILQSLEHNIDYTKQFLAKLEEQPNAAFHDLAINQSDYLVKMNEVVGLLEADSLSKTNRALYIGAFISFLALLILFLQYTFVFRKVEERLHEQNLQLLDKNTQLEHYAYIASHDLQEPLRTVENFVNLFEEDYKDQLDEEAGVYLGFINKAVNRMQQLITSLLEFSKIGQSGDYEKVDVNTLIQAVEEDLAVVIQAKNVQISYDNLPTIKCLKTELNQLFQNLIVNGIKFSPAGQTPHIQIKAKELKKYWQFSVEDNGIGIAPQNIDRVFQMFQRLHNATKYTGQGLGLAFCKKIVDLHFGKIWVESEEGKGSIFHFTIKK